MSETMPQKDWSDFVEGEPDKNGWRPIERAPEDKWLLVGWFFRGRWRECICKWYPSQKAWLSYPGRWAMKPTKFQILPAPPETDHD